MSCNSAMKDTAAHSSSWGHRRGHLLRSCKSFPPATCTASTWPSHQPAAVAGMEGLFNSERGAPLVLVGQPDIEAQRIDNPIVVNKVLSFLIYGTTRRRSAGPEPDSARPVALRAASALLQLPHHGGPGDVLPGADGRRRVYALAWQALHRALDCCGPSCSAFRCRISPTPPAG